MGREYKNRMFAFGNGGGKKKQTFGHRRATVRDNFHYEFVCINLLNILAKLLEKEVRFEMLYLQ